MRAQSIPVFKGLFCLAVVIAIIIGSTFPSAAAEVDATLVHAWSLPFSEDAKAIVTVGDRAYVAAGDEGLTIYDISQPHNPLLLGSLETTYAYDVAVAGNHAYIADYDGGLRIINISDPTAPSLAGTQATSGDAYGLDVVNGFAYVALESSGLAIVNVSNPGSPVPVSTFPTDEYMYDLVVRGDYAFIAEYSDGLLILNVSNPAAPTFVGRVTTDDYVYDVKVDGDYAYLADQGGGLQIVDISNLFVPSIVGTLETEYDARGVFIQGNYAYVAIDSRGFEIVDITDKTAPVQAAWVDTEGSGYDVAVHDGFAYLADNNSTVVFDVSTPTNPVLETGYGPEGEIEQIVAVDQLLYLACDESGVQILDVRQPGQPRRLGGIVTSNQCRRLDVHSNHVYAIDGDGLYVFDASDPANPVRVGYMHGRSYLRDIVVRYPYAFAVDGGLQVIDIRNPATPFEIGYKATSNASWVEVAGDYAYIADGSSGIRVIDILNPTAPELVATYATSRYMPGMEIHGTRLFASYSDYGVEIIDIQDPLNPTLIGHYDTEDQARNMVASGPLGFIADYRKGLQIIDLSDPANPAHMGDYDTEGFAKDLALAHGYAYLAQPSYGGVLTFELRSTNTAMIACTPHQLEAAGSTATSPSPTSLGIRNTGIGTLNYTISAQESWMTPTPASGSSTGETDTIVITFDTTGLAAGFHTGTVTVAASGVVNSPFPIPIELWIEPDTTVITPSNPPPAMEMVAYTAPLTASGGTPPYAWTPSLDWPMGITNAADGTISGRATLAGTYPIALEVSDARGRSSTGMITLLVELNPNRPPVITDTFPLEGSFPMAEFTNQLFTIAAHDPESLPLTYHWMLDGAEVGTNQDSYIFTTDWGDAGTYFLEVQVTDGLWDNVWASWTVEVTDDNDGDGIPNAFEEAHPLLSPWLASDGEDDLDNDHLDNYGEYLAGTNLDDADSDDDSLLDGWEVTYNHNPLDPTGGLRGILTETIGGWVDLNPGVARSVGALQVQGNYAYAGVQQYSNGGQGLRVIDVSIPTNATLVGNYNTANTGSFFREMQVNGTFAYLAQDSAGIHVFNIGTPASPSRTTLIPSNGHYGLDIDGGYLYATDFYQAFQIYSLSNPAFPSLTHALNNSLGWNLVKRGDYVYIARAYHGLQILDVSTPTAPVITANLELGRRTTYALDLKDDFAYLTVKDTGMHVVDIADPSNPVWVSRIATGSSALDIRVQGDYAYLANYTQEELRIIDIKDPLNLKTAGQQDTIKVALSVDVAGDLAYVGAGNGLHIIRCTSEDIDEDGMRDSWETNQWQTLARTGLDDFDNDGIDDLGEFRAGLNPKNDDQDEDDIIDGDEIVLHNSNPFSKDSDGDGISDGDELTCGTSPANAEDVLASTETAPSATEDGMLFSWACIPGHRYRVEYTSDLMNPVWQPASDIVTAGAGQYTCTVTVNAPVDPVGRYYRIVALP